MVIINVFINLFKGSKKKKETRKRDKKNRTKYACTFLLLPQIAVKGHIHDVVMVPVILCHFLVMLLLSSGRELLGINMPIMLASEKEKEEQSPFLFAISLMAFE